MGDEKGERERRRGMREEREREKKGDERGDREREKNGDERGEREREKKGDRNQEILLFNFYINSSGRIFMASSEWWGKSWLS